MAGDTTNVGKRIMAQVIDDLAVQNPRRKVCTLPKGISPSDGFSDLTFQQVAQMINYTSWWIENTLGPSSRLETLAYIGTHDIRYLVMVMACNKTGYKPLLLSPRNSDDAHLYLLDVTDCSRLAYTAEHKQRAMEIRALRSDLQTVQIPSFTEMLEGSAKPYMFSKTFEEVRDEPVLIIHSSGTTGTPKPVTITHGYLGALENCAHVPVPEGRVAGTPTSIFSANDLVFVTHPFFHITGIIMLAVAVLHGIPCVIAPNKPPSTALVIEVLNETKPTAAVFSPSLLEDMSESSTAMDALSRLRCVCYAGAPLSTDVGNFISRRITVINVMGSSEAGLIPSLLPRDEEDWSYFEWNPHCGIEMQSAGHGLYELVLRKVDRDIQSVFHTYPGLQEYHTRDIFTPHPTKPALWRYHGRLDDVIVLSNGEKFNPITMEKVIEGHPLVSRAVVVGQGRFQSALLVEPNWKLWNEDVPVQGFIEHIWPTIQRANNVGQAHGRIMKYKIGVASQSKPFRTTPKGSTRRWLVVEDYKDEIDGIYSKSDADELEFELPVEASPSEIKTLVRNVVSHILPSSAFTNQTNLYAAGLDSLQTMHLSKVLQSALRARQSPGSVTAQKIYANPTVEQLTSLLYGILTGMTESITSRIERLDALVEKYTQDLPEQHADGSGANDQHTVILTGSTGSLGNYILNALLGDPSVSKVYCLNRSEAKARQAKSFEDKGLNCDSAAWAKIEFLQVALREPLFGLDRAKYEEMVRSVDTVIHNAWRVDFNISVASFEDVHIRGVRRLVDFSLESTHNAHIIFVSSVSTIRGWDSRHGPTVPEIPLEDGEVTMAQGYGESKHIAERICLAASRQSGVPTTVLRVGQIAGPTTKKGMWARQEWLPTIVTTSKAIGKVPNSLGSMPVDWIPVDTLATIVLDLIATRRRTQSDTRCSVFHLVNPASTSWKSLLPAIVERYGVQPVELSDWIMDLERIENPSAEEIEEKPALKLLGFYRCLVKSEGASLAPIEVSRTKEASATMTSLGPISPELMANWIDQWAF